MSGLQAGQMLGPYRIIAQIGQGGMATVYRAYHAAMDRDVAIKVLPQQLAESSEFSARFRQEARTIAGLEHPHILPVYDHGESDGLPYLVMRCLDAGTLKDRLGKGRLPLNEIDRLFSQLADALDYAHARGVVHRDLKPSNALLDARGNLFLADFGIAKLLESDKHFTSTGALVGTPAYMSPEQAQGHKVDQRTDIYSLGIILYEMVTGQVPYEAETPLAVILKHINEALPLPSSVYPSISPAIERVILKALAKNPDDRFASVADFLAAWKRALGEAETVRGAAASRSAAEAAAETVVGGSLAPAEAGPEPAVTVVGVPGEAAAQTEFAAGKAVGAAAKTDAAPAARPARRPKRALIWVLGGIGLLAALALLVGGAVVIGQQLFGDQADQLTPQPGTSQAVPAGSPGWTSWAAFNWITALAVDDEHVYTGSWSGMTVWDKNGTPTAHYTMVDGLPDPFVNDLLVDPDEGNLWIATDGGIVQQTDEGWVVYDMSDGLDSYVVLGIESTQQGLLAGTGYSDGPGAGLDVLGEGGWQRFGGFPSGDAPDLLHWNVHMIREWENGELWVGTMNGLGHYDPEAETWELYFTEDGLPDNQITALLVDGPQQAWVATSGGTVRFIEGRFEAVPQLDGLSIDYADGMLRDARGWYWFASYDGIRRYNPDNADWTFYPESDFGVDEITVIAEDDDGRLYFGSDNGLIVYDGEGFSTWRVPNTLTVWRGYERILPAQDGSLWFVGGSTPETDRFDPATETWSLLSDLPWDYIPLAIDQQGNTWCMEYGEGLHRINANLSVTSWTTATGLPSNEIYSLAIAPDGTAWVGTQDGLAQLENDQVVQVYNRSSGLQDDTIYQVFAASDGSVWVYTNNYESGDTPGVSLRQPDGQWEHLGSGNPFLPEWDGVSSFAEDANGAVWLTINDDALYQYQQGQWSRHNLPENYDWFTTLAFGPDGSLWVGTGDAGVYRLDSNGWQNFGVKDGLIYPEIHDIYVEANGTVWFAAWAGVTRYIP